MTKTRFKSSKPKSKTASYGVKFKTPWFKAVRGKKFVAFSETQYPEKIKEKMKFTSAKHAIITATSHVTVYRKRGGHRWAVHSYSAAYKHNPLIYNDYRRSKKVADNYRKQGVKVYDNPYSVPWPWQKKK